MNDKSESNGGKRRRGLVVAPSAGLFLYIADLRKPQGPRGHRSHRAPGRPVKVPQRQGSKEDKEEQTCRTPRDQLVSLLLSVSRTLAGCHRTGGEWR